MAVVQVLFCPGCGGERDFEQPPCDDGHGFDCPEWACVECGMAVLGGWVEGIVSATDVEPAELLLQDTG